MLIYLLFDDRLLQFWLALVHTKLSGTLEPLAIMVTPEKQAQFITNIQKRYIIALKGHLESWLQKPHLLDAFCIFDPSKQKDENVPHLQVLTNQYCQGDCPLVEDDGLRPEWELFEVLLSTFYSSLFHYQVMTPVVGNEMLRLLYPNLCKLTQICLIFPLSTADCERAFSTIKSAKIPLCNCLNTKTLDSLM